MACHPSPLAPLPEPGPATWPDDLRAGGTRREQAIRELHALLVRAARHEASRRGIGSPVSGVELADLAQQAADDALVAILAKLEQFRGDSRFTTWAYKFVVLEVASKLTRHTWRTRPTAFDQTAWERLPDRFGFTPEEAVQRREVLDAIRVAVETVLTPHQRRVFVAIVLNGVPLDVLVTEQDTSRNALYKTLFDARRKLRAYLVANGHAEPR